MSKIIGPPYKSHWSLVAVVRRTGEQYLLPRSSKWAVEGSMESMARLEPDTYSHFIVIETREGRTPVLTQFENPKA